MANFRLAIETTLFAQLTLGEALQKSSACGFAMVEVGLSHFDACAAGTADVEGLEELQRMGRLRPGLDARYLQLALVSLTLMPAALPQMAQLVTGLSTSDPRFREGQETFLKELGRLLAPPS